MERPGIAVEQPRPLALPLSENELKAWMLNYLSTLLSIEAATIDTSAQFDSLGLDSIEAVVMAGVMEEEFDVLIEPTLLLQYPSIDLFAAACHRDSSQA